MLPFSNSGSLSGSVSGSVSLCFDTWKAGSEDSQGGSAGGYVASRNCVSTTSSEGDNGNVGAKD